MSKPIGWLTLNRADKHNAITISMWEEISHLLDIADKDPAVKVVIVRGSGTSAFASGADLRDVLDVAKGVVDRERYIRLYGDAQRALASFRKPTVAMIHGYCFGAGCGIATACDFRWVDERAQFGVPAAKMGQIYRLEETRRLVKLVGFSSAKRMLYTGAVMDAREAMRVGLADAVCEPESLEADTIAFVEQIASVSQFSVQTMKRIFSAIDDGRTVDDQTTIDLFLSALHGEDFEEAMAARAEGRAPDFPFR
ncbi:MAG: enoyl-CoA hydratase/isomerase family protein [Bauldia litoralis]